MIELGWEYRDKVTGFVGVATEHTTTISGHNRTLLESESDGSWNSKVGHSQWFDDWRLQKVTQRVTPANTKEAT